MKIRNLLFLALPLLAISITSCGKGNNGDDNGGGGGGGKASSIIKSDEEKSAAEQEAAAFYKAITGKDGERGVDYFNYGTIRCEVKINYKNQYDNHQVIGELAVSKLDKIYDLETYQEKGYAKYFQTLGSYSDAMTAQFGKYVNGKIAGQVTITTIHVVDEKDKERLSTTKYTATGTVVTGPDIGDWYLRVEFLNA